LSSEVVESEVMLIVPTGIEIGMHNDRSDGVIRTDRVSRAGRNATRRRENFMLKSPVCEVKTNEARWMKSDAAEQKTSFFCH
jgi:hypothetical protein